MNRDVDEPTEGLCRTSDAVRLVVDVQIEDHAGVVRTRPRERGFAVALDQAHGAVNQIDLMSPEVFPHVAYEGGEACARHVKFGDHLRSRHAGFESAVETTVIVVEVHAELMRVAPVDLPARAQIEIGELVERAALVAMGEVEEAPPVRRRQADLAVWNDGTRIHGAIAGKHAA